MGRAAAVLRRPGDRRTASATRWRCSSSAAAKVEQGGIEAWFEATHEDFGVDAKNYRKLTDTLDVWFDSGTTHQTVMGGPTAVRTRLASQQTVSRRPLSRRLGPASRLVPFVAADVVHAERRAAVQGAADARLRRRRRRPQDVEVEGQRRRAAESRRHARRRDPAPVGRGDRLFGRAVDLRRDPEARRRELSAHPQHAALPAREHLGLRSGEATRCRPPSCSRSTATRSR